MSDATIQEAKENIVFTLAMPMDKTSGLESLTPEELDQIQAPQVGTTRVHCVPLIFFVFVPFFRLVVKVNKHFNIINLL